MSGSVAERLRSAVTFNVVTQAVHPTVARRVPDFVTVELGYQMPNYEGLRVSDVIDSCIWVCLRE